ncbi:hypothetical protein [Mycolicibacterium fluoranthenivorans]|uniref:DUF7159 domain-containing protein n=1 Tax=Mycolicibacterium fluoranthenivorans TaxID=258505 RepID=A0A7X5ZDY9_9MYCO|nr:hypothetical protein [Mycolicibacterium fluoranthenivorans]MCV7354861.1 hypothetical protein [Mycolicibacterium fluoranthenivorans]NIH96550.1 hypothetical protein [Mycolicibacterium fluoranthenivorans]
MKTVLGLSVTSAGVGWVLVDGAEPEALTVDDDSFSVATIDDLQSRALAAVRGAQAIASASGHEIESIGVTWGDDVAAHAAQLIATLKECGYADVRSVRLQNAAPAAADHAAHTAAARAVTLTDADLSVLLDVDIEPEPADPDDSLTVAVALPPEAAEAPTTRFTPAYDAARAVATNAVPAGSTDGRVHRLRGWVRDASPARLATMAGAAAVTAVIALLAVGSQFSGPDVPAPLATATQPVSPAAGTSQIVSSIPAPVPQAQELVVPEQSNPEPPAAPPPVYSEAIVPLQAGEPAAIPVIPVEVPPHVAVAPEQVPATAPLVEQAPGPLPGPPPAAVPAVPEQQVPEPQQVPAPQQEVPVPAESVPAPPPVDPIQAAINSLFPPPAPAPAPVP